MTEKNIKQHKKQEIEQIKDELHNIKLEMSRNNLFWDIWEMIEIFESKGCVCDIYIQLKYDDTWKTPQQLMLTKKDLKASYSRNHLIIVLENECFILNIHDIQEICIKAHKT